ncbi:extracellular solute-binding protein [Uliginosibacterium sp. 31-16]|uniref:extracellular solute-binding protein n=1 Tax=Uliginosibacterium sp. 31-16 TaxID=3068315 RepID=UPI00273D448B|nr:extracellular solute-binding protein [Uliginosibacterium sp. 31-16]MDP5238353.1 extracellular solute-binding protein [Uliginosibacterium sp. 31-16]
MHAIPSRAGQGLLVSLVLALAAIPAQAAPAQKAPAASAASSLTIELSHQLGADKGNELAALVERFNAQSKLGRIALSDRPWGQGGQSQLTILADAEDEASLIGARRFKPLWQVMKDAGEPLQTLPVPRFMVPSAVDASGRPLALPVGLSTPVVFFNKDALSKAGADLSALPKSWNEWQDVLGKLYQNGVTCPMTVSQPVSTLIENASAWNNQAFVTGGKNEQIAVNGLIQVKHIAKMSTWYKSRYLHYFGRSTEGEDRFATGECAVLVGPSAAFPTLVRSSAFPVGVSSYPYHDDAYGAPQNTWADGPALWVAAGRSASEYKLAAAFVRFWLAPQNQVDWQVNAGYLPLSSAGLLATQASKLLKDELAAQRVAIAQLTFKPVSPFSAASAYGHRAGVRRVLADEMEQVFADKKPSKQGLDDAVQRIRSGRMN